MELPPQKRARIRKKKRLAKNRRRNQRKFEVRTAKRRRCTRDNASFVLTEEMNFSEMTADTFWENYKVAQEWQQKHNVAWWRSRCTALEYENRILRKKVREQAQLLHHNAKRAGPSTFHNSEESAPAEEENLEFQVDEDMMSFLEQSIRHKMELKKMRESEKQNHTDTRENVSRIGTREVQDHEKMENARQLYGSASSKITGMEAALQATVDRHRDRANPHYWPNIPLKP